MDPIVIKDSTANLDLEAEGNKAGNNTGNNTSNKAGKVSD